MVYNAKMQNISTKRMVKHRRLERNDFFAGSLLAGLTV